MHKITLSRRSCEIIIANLGFKHWENMIKEIINSTDIVPGNHSNLLDKSIKLVHSQSIGINGSEEKSFYYYNYQSEGPFK
ncbi:MAG: hypothetical protein P4L79_17420 [Legionella sp.]|uniref:hypothetical protein n=1 Tax=Legionella sp. TaxID=459 RepID=UPI00284A07EF|nr:hypothetical protein [Legionella sp.]